MKLNILWSAVFIFIHADDDDPKQSMKVWTLQAPPPPLQQEQQQFVAAWKHPVIEYSI